MTVLLFVALGRKSKSRAADSPPINSAIRVVANMNISKGIFIVQELLPFRDNGPLCVTPDCSMRNDKKITQSGRKLVAADITVLGGQRYAQSVGTPSETGVSAARRRAATRRRNAVAKFVAC